MEGTASYDFGTDVEFPSVPGEKIPDDVHALRRILAGQRGLQMFYARLDEASLGESHWLTVLLRRDWQRHFRDLLGAGAEIVRSLGYKGELEETLPTPEKIAEIVKVLSGLDPPGIFVRISAFASHALLCHQMVPWVSEVKEVFEYFKDCVEAEDRHLAVLQLFGDLLEPQGEAP